MYILAYVYACVIETPYHVDIYVYTHICIAVKENDVPTCSNCWSLCWSCCQENTVFQQRDEKALTQLREADWFPALSQPTQYEYINEYFHVYICRERTMVILHTCHQI